MLRYIIVTLITVFQISIVNTDAIGGIILSDKIEMHSNDTINYFSKKLKNSKSQFIGKKFEKLINKSSIKPKSVQYTHNLSSMSEIQMINLYYYSHQNVLKRINKVPNPFLSITFIEPIPSEEFSKIALASGLEFTPALFKYLKKYHIKSVDFFY